MYNFCMAQKATCDLRVKKLYFDEPGARNLRSDSASLSRAFGDTLNPFALITPPKPRSSSFSSNSEASLSNTYCMQYTMSLMNLCDGGIREQNDRFLQNRSTRAASPCYAHKYMIHVYM